MSALRGHLSSEAEFTVFVISIGIVVGFVLLTELSILRERRELRRFYEKNEYRATGEVYSRRQVTSRSGLDCWELKIRYQDASGDEQTAALSTCDPEIAGRTLVNLALLQPGALPPETMCERYDRMNAHEREHLTIEEHRALLRELLDAQEIQSRRERYLSRTLGLEPKRVRLWEERYETAEEREEKRARRRRAWRTALLILALAIVTVLLVRWTANK